MEDTAIKTVRALMRAGGAGDPERVSAVRDLHADGVFAVRAWFADRTEDYLLHPDAGDGEPELEECEFTTWPPRLWDGGAT